MMEPRLEEFRAAAEMLIDSIVVTPGRDPEGHGRIRRHVRALNAWFGERTGWRVSDHPEFARLVKPAVRWEPAHAVSWAKDRRDYELFAWVLWYAEHVSARKFTLSQLAEEIRTQSGRADPEQAFDWRKQPERRRLTNLLKVLEEMAVIRVRDGSFLEWQDDLGKRDALCEWGTLAWQFQLALPTESLERLAAGEPLEAAVRERVHPSPLVRAYRQLLLGPALFRHDDPQAYHTVCDDPETRRRVARDLLDHTGWEMEVTTSYMRLMRTTTRPESDRMPLRTDSSETQVVLLLCAALRDAVGEERLRSGGGDHFPITSSELELLLLDIREAHSENWRKDLRGAPARKLLELVLPRMLRWGFLRDAGEERYVITPLAARLAGEYLLSDEDD